MKSIALCDFDHFFLIPLKGGIISGTVRSPATSCSLPFSMVYHTLYMALNVYEFSK